MKKLFFSSIFMLSVSFASANTTTTEMLAINKKVNLKEMAISSNISHSKKAKVSSSDDDSAGCEFAGWVAEKTARKLGANRKTAKQIRLVVELACEEAFD